MYSTRTKLDTETSPFKAMLLDAEVVMDGGLAIVTVGMLNDERDVILVADCEMLKMFVTVSVKLSNIVK
jgi:hypothetical protein